MRQRVLESSARVTEDALPAIAETALGDAALFTNPRPAIYEDVLEIARGAW